jgi:hypothetical protein
MTTMETEHKTMLRSETIRRTKSIIEDDSEAKAPYSFVKSYFVNMLQPADNKLAMKLFGSKKGVLREKKRQLEVSHWIVHPCSNFRLVGLFEAFIDK